MCRWRGAQGGTDPGGYPGGHVAGRVGVGSEVTQGASDPLLG